MVEFGGGLKKWRLCSHVAVGYSEYVYQESLTNLILIGVISLNQSSISPEELSILVFNATACICFHPHGIGYILTSFVLSAVEFRDTIISSSNNIGFWIGF